MPRSLARELITPGLHVDRAGLYGWTAALNTLPVVGAVVWGLAADELRTGLLVAAGALFAGIPGLGSPPRKRMTAMAVTSFLVFLSTFVGVWTGGTDLLAMALMATWAFGGAMLGCLGRTEGLIGATSVLALLLVAEYPSDFEGAVLRALLALAGCLGQVALTVAVWRIARDRPQRDALCAAYARVAALARAPRIQGELLGVLAELREVATTVQDAEGGRAPRSPRGRARRTLLREADAIVLEVAALRSLGDQGVDVGEPLRVAAEDLDAVAAALRAGHGTHDIAAAIAQGDAAQAAMGASERGDPALRDEAIQRVDHLREHLRAAWRATAAATGPHVPGRVLDPAQTRRRLADARGVLRANLTLDSAVCRHAVRLGVATAVGVGIYRLFDITHGYWIPLTVLFVLRPDFGSTFSRGGLRAAGTILGILLAGGVTWALGGDDTLALIPIAVFCWGALAFLFANYAVFTTSITALVILMVDLAGEPAVDAMGERLVASAIGIVIALISFLVWPTWTRERMAGAVGQYVDALRAYAVGVLQACLDPATYAPQTVDPLRMAQRLARANADDALAATLHEPQHRRGRSGAAQALLGAGYHVHEAAIVLDVHVRDGERDHPRPGLEPLVQDVDTTLAGVERWWTDDATDAVKVPPSPVPQREGEPALTQEIRALAAAAHAMACATQERRSGASA